jgi:3-methylcrotonyl-CoA carboxylase alpha subunit
VRRRTFDFRGQEGAEYRVELSYGRDAMTFKGAATNSLAAFESTLSFEILGETELSLTLDGHRLRVVTLIDGDEIYVRTQRGRFVLTRQDPFQARQQSHVTDDRIIAPLPGTVVAVFAAEGDRLDKGAPVVTLEVMKMEQVLRAPFPGVVRKLACKVGDVVQEGTVLAHIDAQPS